MKIKIISDGTSFNTKIIDTETNEPVKLPISKIIWSVNGKDHMAKAILEVEIMQIEAEAEIDEIIKKYHPLVKPPATPKPS